MLFRKRGKRLAHLCHSSANNYPAWKGRWGRKVVFLAEVPLVGSESFAEQLQNCAPRPSFQHYYHNLWWESNRSSIRGVGKVTTPKTRGRRFSSGLTGVSWRALCALCVLSLITPGLKSARGVRAFILTRSSSSSSLTAGRPSHPI